MPRMTCNLTDILFISSLSAILVFLRLGFECIIGRKPDKARAKRLAWVHTSYVLAFLLSVKMNDAIYYLIPAGEKANSLRALVDYFFFANFFLKGNFLKTFNLKIADKKQWFWELAIRILIYYIVVFAILGMWYVGFFIVGPALEEKYGLQDMEFWLTIFYFIVFVFIMFWTGIRNNLWPFSKIMKRH